MKTHNKTAEHSATLQANHTAELAEFAASLSFDSLSDEVRHRAGLLVLDSLASALLGRSGEGSRSIVDTLRRITGPGTTTAIGGHSDNSLLGGVFINGYLITASGWCDVYLPAHAHITPAVVAPALGLGEQYATSGRDFLTAVVAGLEVTCRLGLGINSSALRRQGWHAPGVLGPLGSAITSGRLLGLDALRLRNAIGLAGSQSSGTMAHWGTPTVKFHQGRAAASGITSAYLAETGFRSAPNFVSSSDGGLLESYSTGGQADRITEGLGSEWEFLDIATRPWPAGTALQSTISSAIRIAERLHEPPSSLRSIEVRLPSRAYNAHHEMTWDYPLEAQLSVRYIVAAVMFHKLFDMTLFSPDRLSNAAVAELAQRMTIVEDPSMITGCSHLSVVTSGGEVHSEERGFPEDNPSIEWTDERIIHKFRIAAAAGLPKHAQTLIIQCSLGLPDVSDIKSLVTMLGSSQEGQQ